MRKLLCILFVVLFSACKKDDLIFEIPDLIGKYLVCDSIKTIESKKETTTVKGKGTGLDVTFGPSSTYTIYATPVHILNYYVRYSKIYYWERNVSQHEGDYFKIIAKTGNRLTLEHRDINTGIKTVYYYTAE